MEQVVVLPCPTRSMGAGICRHPCGALEYIYKYISREDRSSACRRFVLCVCRSINRLERQGCYGKPLAQDKGLYSALPRLFRQAPKREEATRVV